MSKVLVLDANQRSALAIIRNLGHRDIHVVTADYIKPSIGAVSKYSAASAQYTDPMADPARFVDDIREIVRRQGIDVIFPATDLTTMLLASQPECISPARLACPSAQSYEKLTDKRLLISLAQELGIPAPDTRVAFTTSEIHGAAAEFGYPLVLKPSRSRYLKDNRVFSTSVRIIGNPDHLAATVGGLEWLKDIPCLVQRFIPGYGAGIFTVYAPAQPVAWFAHKRIREKPPAGGVSVLSESVTPDPRMQASAERLLSAAHWFGVAMVEFRVATDGTPYLMEVNGRFWGSLQLAIDCGVDFPWLLYQLVDGHTPATVSSYAIGRRLRWLLGDVDNLILQLRGSQLTPTGKVKATGRFLQSFFDGSCRQEVFRWDDPKPGLREVRDWIGNLIQ